MKGESRGDEVEGLQAPGQRRKVIHCVPLQQGGKSPHCAAGPGVGKLSRLCVGRLESSFSVDPPQAPGQVTPPLFLSLQAGTRPRGLLREPVLLRLAGHRGPATVSGPTLVPEPGEACVHSGVESAAWRCILALPPAICMTPLIFVTVSVPWFPHLSNHSNDSPVLTHGLLRGLMASEGLGYSGCAPSVRCHDMVPAWDQAGRGPVELSTGRG